VSDNVGKRFETDIHTYIHTYVHTVCAPVHTLKSFIFFLQVMFIRVSCGSLKRSNSISLYTFHRLTFDICTVYVYYAVRTDTLI
jgi:hypothetical protein